MQKKIELCFVIKNSNKYPKTFVKKFTKKKNLKTYQFNTLKH